MATKTWIGGHAGTPTSANDGLNWSPNGVPGADDDIVIDSNATAAFTWDIPSPKTVKSFTVAANAAAGAHCWFGTAGAQAFTVTGDFVFLGSDSNMEAVWTDTCTITVGGNFTWGSDSTMEGGDRFSLVMTGVDKIFSCEAVGCGFLNLTFQQNASITKWSAGTSVQIFTLESSKTLTVSAGLHINLTYYWGAGFTNNGIINFGNGCTLHLMFYNQDRTLGLGTITGEPSILVENHPSAAIANRILYMGDNWQIHDLEVKCDNEGFTMEVNHGLNYILSATGATTVGTRGRIVSGSGDFRFMDGYAQTGVDSVVSFVGDVIMRGTVTKTNGTLNIIGTNEQFCWGLPDAATTINATGPVILYDCALTHANITATAGTIVWIDDAKYTTHGNLSMSGITMRPDGNTDVENMNGTLTLDIPTRMRNLTTDAGCTTVQSAGVQLGICGKISTEGTFTRNTPSAIIRDFDIARAIPFPANLCVNWPAMWGEA